MNLIESVPDGWWYLALLPKKIRVTSFLPIEFACCTICQITKWMEKGYEKTKHVKSNLEKYNYGIISGPHVMLANSSVLERAVGENWLAVGDASPTFDSISSNGILTAIDNGIIAADTITKNFHEKDGCFEDYNKKITAEFHRYQIKRNYYYNLEKRWMNNLLERESRIEKGRDGYYFDHNNQHMIFNILKFRKRWMITYRTLA